MSAVPTSERAMGMRLERRALHGVLLLDKPLGLSSNQALQKAKWLFRAQKAGHTGTLDPMACGLLPICFGAATKFSHACLDSDKAYTAEVLLGTVTDTGDAEGRVLEIRQVCLDPERVDAAIAAFRGEIDQIPPMHSALKREGVPLYRYARQGLSVDRQPRRVKIHELQGLWNASNPQRLTLSVRCSKGTYIRVLAQDIGRAMGCGASLLGLRRTHCAGLSVLDAVTLEELEGLDEEARLAHVLPSDVLLSDWPSIELEAEEASRFITGLRRRVARPDCPAVRVYGPTRQSGSERRALLGTAHITAGELIPDRLLSPPELQAQA